MLALQTYRFWVGRKIPFSDWPEIIQTFFNKQSLRYNNFLYYFEDNHGGLPKIMKDCPQVGPIRMRTTNIGETFYLSNIEADTECTESDIMSLMPKIYRRYGFSETHIIYQDIDFFSQNIPAIIHPPGNTPSCIKGSSITLYRDSVFHGLNRIDLRIIINDGHTTFDPTPYFEAMKQLLPGIRHINFVECCMSADEQTLYTELNQTAAPLLEYARSYLTDLLSDKPEPTFCASDAPKLSVAPILKKLCKQHGYTYRYECRCFSAEKRTKNGHIIFLDIDVGRNSDELNCLIRYVGVGFNHQIAYSSYLPKNQNHVEACLSHCFQALISAEADVFPALDTHFPPTPTWFTH